jgi:hypothetical protein
MNGLKVKKSKKKPELWLGLFLAFLAFLGEMLL